MSEPYAKRRIVVAGGGTAGWMAAAALARTMGDAIELTLVESEAIGTVGVGESTIPPVVTFNRVLGISEAEFMRATSATFKLGIEFTDWKVLGEKYFHSFGVTGRDHWSAGFQHFWMHGLARGHQAGYDDYCLELNAAYAGKFVHLPDNRVNYAYHLDATRYARFLRQLAEADGAVRVEGKIAEVALDPASGNIAALVLDSGRRIEGDLFLDCTGFRALLIEGALHVGYDDWTHYLPCDAAIAVQTASVRPPIPYTRAIAHDSGWQWRIPLQHRQGNGIVYCSRYLEREAALERLLSSIEGDRLTEPNMLRFVTGARRKQWHRNCIAVGLSGGFLEPLESTSIYLIQAAISALVELFPEREISPVDRDEFNRLIDLEYDRIRDFLILHYHATERDDTPFWNYCRNMPIPATLEERLAIYRENARLYRHDNELFSETSWFAVMHGQNITPSRYHPIADLLPAAELEARMAKMADMTRNCLRAMPTHQQFIDRYCKAEA